VSSTAPPAACAACLGSGRCWVCLGTGKLEHPGATFTTCDSCDATGACPHCPSSTPPQRTADRGRVDRYPDQAKSDFDTPVLPS
jgi:hypothetical protein